MGIIRVNNIDLITCQTSAWNHGKCHDHLSNKSQQMHHLSH